ncbi:MAG: DNA polymerase/3'-5' exonuclease PolX [candidate division KSB1 bacterium]|nr:DNA polymerase/3'-5' exonuclease PolX [candidate division KSB1 bacterium]
MKNKDTADILDRFGDVLEFLDESRFKINAYRRAARAITEMADDIEVMWNENRLGDIPGVGKALQEKISQFLETGRISQLDELLKQTPKDIFALLSIPYFGPKTAALAYQQLGVETLDDLQKQIETGKLAELPNMGAKKVEKIKNGLERRQQANERFSIGLAWPMAEHIIDYIKENCTTDMGRIMPAGSVRRFRETVHDVDILVETDDGKSVIDTFVSMPDVTQVLAAGDTKASVLVNDKFQIDLRAIPTSSYGAALQYFTGSQAHNVRLRERAKKAGYKISEYGIYNGDEQIGGKDEAELYEALNIDWVPPELREDRGEIEAAEQGDLPELLTLNDIRGDMHVHSHYSDGHNTCKEMAVAAVELGYEYLVFCDHSQSSTYANGLSEERLQQQIKEVRALNAELDSIEILSGIELNIHPDGKLDFPDSVLKQLDFVVASVHSGFERDATERTIAAMNNPFVDVIGHPTGRLITRRDPLTIDMERVISAAAETGTALEINANWDRLDLKDIHARQAVRANVKLCINTDSHDTGSLYMMVLGVGTARRGWVSRYDVLNTMPLTDLRSRQKRNRM